MKKNLFLTILLVFTVSNLLGQTENKSFSPCEEKVNYAVDDIQLKQKFGNNLQIPNSNPKFIGGISELKKYFSENKLSNEKAKGIVFRVHIGFIINCNGEIGSFELVSNGKGDLKILGEEVLNIVSKMPKNWEAAKIDGKSTDSYQILSFTIVDGDLTKVNYR